MSNRLNEFMEHNCFCDRIPMLRRKAALVHSNSPVNLPFVRGLHGPHYNFGGAARVGKFQNNLGFGTSGHPGEVAAAGGQLQGNGPANAATGAGY